jgi:hypothetical protein
MKLVSSPSPAIPAIHSASTAGSAGSPCLLLQSIPRTFSGAPSPSDSDMACRSCAHADRRLSSLMLSSSPLFVIAAPPALPTVASQINHNQCQRGLQERMERRHIVADSMRAYLALRCSGPGGAPWASAAPALPLPPWMLHSCGLQSERRAASRCVVW